MYDENSFKNYIFWLQVKRVFLMIVFSIVGAFIGILLSQFLIDVLLILDSSYKVIFIAISTLLFFGISLLLTAGTGKEVQEGYWKMAVLRKLTVISKKLDYLENLEDSSKEKKEIVKKVVKDVKQEIAKNLENEQPQTEDTNILKNDNNNIIIEKAKNDNTENKENHKISTSKSKKAKSKKAPTTKQITELAKK